MSIVLLLSRQRSGTGALASVLERHPDICYAGEILDPTSQLRPFSGWLADRGATIASNDDLASHMLDFIETMRAESQINLVDIKYNSLSSITPSFHSFCDIPWILQVFSMVPVPMIHLYRSPLETYVSAKIAEKCQVFHTTERLTLQEKLQVNVDDFAEYFRICQREDRFFSEFFDGYKFHASIEYDTCFEADGHVSASAMAELAQLLDLDFDGIDLMPRFVRQAPVSRAAKISNLDEVTAWLRKHGELVA